MWLMYSMPAGDAHSHAPGPAHASGTGSGALQHSVTAAASSVFQQLLRVCASNTGCQSNCGGSAAVAVLIVSE